MRRSRWGLRPQTPAQGCRPLVAIPLVLLALPQPALANMAQSVLEGDRPGVLVPSNKTAVRVEGETLEFVVDASLSKAAVTASYRMSNGGAEPESDEIAFVYVRPDGGQDPEAQVEIDGAPVETRVESDGDLLEPALRQWLAAHKEVDQALRAVVDRGDSVGGDPALKGPVHDAGGRCTYDDCRNLVIWYRMMQRSEEEPTSKRVEDDRTFLAASEAIPQEVEALARRWSTSPDRPRLGFVRFTLDTAPGQRRTVTVRYRQHAGVDHQRHVNDTFLFDYLLSPAKQWASFGPLDVTVRAPEGVALDSSLPLRREADAYHLSLAALPEGELRFSLSSRAGLWFGWAEPENYGRLLAACVLGAALAVGASTGRFWQKYGRMAAALLRVFAAGPLAASVSFAVIVLLALAFPPRALGFGYGGIVLGTLLLLLAIPAGAMASFVAGAVHARRRPR